MERYRLTCCVISLFLLIGGVQAQVAAPQAALNDALSNLLREADALIKSGRQADAYRMLEPEEGDYSGETAYDYLLGIAALDSGKPDRATIAFERVLIVNPNFAGARLDLARAYFAMGSDDMAKNEFETVLAQNPPAPTAAVIKKHLDVIAERQLAKVQQVITYLETNFGHDSNITVATLDNIKGVAGILGRSQAELIALQYRPTGSSLQYSGNYAGISGGVDFNRVVDEERGLSMHAGVDVKQRVYNGVSAMNNLTMDYRAGVGITSENNRYRLTGTFGQYRQSGFPQATPSNAYRDTAGLNVEWKHAFAASDQMGLSLGVSRPRYPADINRAQDTNQLALNASWLHLFEGEMNPLIFANFNRAVDKALRPVNVVTGADMGRTTTGALIHFQFTPLPDTDFFFSGGLTQRRDDSPGARSPGLPDFFARDDTRNANFGFITRPWKQWSIKGTIAITSNRSNLSLYDYHRKDSSISLRKDF